MARRMGRPPKGGKTLSKADVLTEALLLLDTAGMSGLTFKALAERLNVTPMAVAHHVGSRQNMLSLLVASVFSGVEMTSHDDQPIQRIRGLMQAYCVRVIQHPELVRCILNDPGMIGQSLLSLTEAVRSALLEAGVANKEREVVLGVIVDYTHGFAFAAAADPDASLSVADFTVGLDWVLQGLANPKAQT